MKRFGKVALPLLLAVAVFAVTVSALLLRPPAARAATPISGSYTAKAGTGGVTGGLFVKLEAAGTIITATAVTDSVVGVCELTADANDISRYAPMGTRCTVTSGENIAVGDLLTAGAGGKAFVVDADDASSQRVAGLALTAASGADEDVTVILIPGMVEQRLALASAAIGGGYGSTGVTISAAGVIQADGAITSTGAITGGTITDGTVSRTAGSVTGTWVDLGTITTADINGGSIDGVTIGAAAAPTVTDLGAVATCDINGGSIDGVTIGAAAAPTVTDLGSVATCDINGGSIDGVTIGAAAAPTVTDLGAVATCDINGGTVDGVTIGGAAAGAITGTTITGTTITDGTISTTAGAVTGTLDISGATVTYRAILNADIDAGAAIVRSKLAEDALQVYAITAGEWRNDDGSVMDASGGAGLFSITTAGMGTGTLTIDGEAANTDSKTDTMMFEFALRPEYVDAGDVTLVVELKESVGAANTATTFSTEVYECDGDGTVSADLAGAPDVTDVTASWQTSTTAITAAALVKGDKIRVFIKIITNDTGGTTGTIAQIGKIEIRCDIKG